MKRMQATVGSSCVRAHRGHVKRIRRTEGICLTAGIQTDKTDSTEPPPLPCHLSGHFRAVGAGSARLVVYRVADRERDLWWAVSGA